MKLRAGQHVSADGRGWIMVGAYGTQGRAASIAKTIDGGRWTLRGGWYVVLRPDLLNTRATAGTGPAAGRAGP